MRTAVAEWNAKALRIPDGDVRAPLAGRREKREREQIRGRNHQRLRRVRPLRELAIIVNGAVGAGVLHKHAKHVIAERCGTMITDDDVHPAHVRTRANHVDGLWVTELGDEERVLIGLASHGVRQRHGFSGRGGLVQERGIGDLEPRQVDHHRLKVEQRLQSSLRDFRLIRCVGRIPAWVLEDVSLNRRGRNRVVEPKAEERPGELVLVCQRAQRRQRLVFGLRWRQFEIALHPNGRGHRGVDQLVERPVAQCPDHFLHFIVRWPYVARGERVGHQNGDRGGWHVSEFTLASLQWNPLLLSPDCPRGRNRRSGKALGCLYPLRPTGPRTWRSTKPSSCARADIEKRYFGSTPGRARPSRSGGTSPRAAATISSSHRRAESTSFGGRREDAQFCTIARSPTASPHPSRHSDRSPNRIARSIVCS